MRNLKLESRATVFYARSVPDRIVIRQDSGSLVFAANTFPAGEPLGAYMGHQPGLMPVPGYLARFYGVPMTPEQMAAQDAAYKAYMASQDAYEHACREIAAGRA